MEKFVPYFIGILCIAMIYFLWAGYRAIKISIQRYADKQAKEMSKQRPTDARLICGFMGYEIWKPWIARFKPFEHEMVTTHFGVYSFYEFEEKLRSDWGWLHEITNQIGHIPFQSKDGMREWMSIEWSDAKINIHSTKREVYDKIIQFINRYNNEG